MADWTDTLEALAPGLATALGGPVAGLAVTAIEKVFGLEPGAGTPETMALALNTATPDQLLALKKADQEFTVQMKQLDIDLEKIGEQDRDSARQMQAQDKSKIPATLAIMLTVGFFTLLGLMAFKDIPTENKDVLNLMVGSLGTAWITMIAFYFGSSRGSQGKDETIKLLSK